MSKELIEALEAQSIGRQDLRADGDLTIPRSYGVYDIGPERKAAKRYRFGNHPIRQNELLNEFGHCELLNLFLRREQALKLASLLNGRKA